MVKNFLQDLFILCFPELQISPTQFRMSRILFLNFI